MKKRKLLSIIALSTLSIPIFSSMAILTSCSESSFSYTYDETSKTLTLNSKNIGYDNIYYGVQAILSNNNKYNDWKNISLLLSNNLPTLFTNSNIEIANVNLNNYVLELTINNNDKVSTIKISFPKVNLNGLNPPNSNIFYVQSNTVFFNNSIQDIINMSSERILNKIREISNVNLPENCYIDKSMSISSPNYVDFYIFLPESKQPYGLLKIYLENVEVPNVLPIGPINNFDSTNEWSKIINWNVDSIEGTTYKYIDNIITDYTSATPIVSSYSTAKSSQIVNNNFLYLYNNDYLSNINDDFNYGAKNSLSLISTSWNVKNILDLNVYIGNTLVTNNDSYISGDYVIQFMNPLDYDVHLNSDNIYWNINIPDITVPSKGIVTIKFSFNNSDAKPYLTLASDIDNTAYLTTEFNNLSIELFVNNDKVFSENSSSNFKNFLKNSYTLKTIVKNVKFGNNLIDISDQLKSNIQNVTINDLTSNNKEFVEANINKFKVMLKSIQNILLLSANNPTIIDFLYSLNNDIYNIIFSLTNNKYLSNLIANLFSNQKLSVFLFYNIDNIIGIIETMLPNSIEKASLLGMLYDIRNSNTSPTDMEDFVANLVSLKPMLEKVLSAQLGWLLKIIGPLLENLSLNPNLFDCILTMLPDILNVVASQTGQIGVIGNSILTYVSNLITFANTNDPDCANNPILNNKYEDIRVLDFVVNEFTQGNENSLMDILGLIIGPNNATINTIINVVKAVNFNINCKIRVSKKGIIVQTYNYENKNLYDVIKWIINAFFTEVKLADGTITDLYSAISNNLQFTHTQNNLTYDNQQYSVNAYDNWTFNLKQQITINTLPIAALISKENINLDLSSLNVPPILNSLINVLINNAIPVNLVISPKNVVKTSFESINSHLFPLIETDGKLRWNYLSNNTTIVDFSNVLNESNVRSTAQEKCYGGSFGLLKTLLPTFISLQATTNKITWMSTNNLNNETINNYNATSYISELYVNQLVDDLTLTTNFTTWISDKTNYYQAGDKFVINTTSLNQFINQNFKFSNSFGTNFAYYHPTITSASYKLINNTNSYTLNIVFSAPTLVIKPDNTCVLTDSYTVTINV